MCHGDTDSGVKVQLFPAVGELCMIAVATCQNISPVMNALIHPQTNHTETFVTEANIPGQMSEHYSILQLQIRYFVF